MKLIALISIALLICTTQAQSTEVEIVDVDVKDVYQIFKGVLEGLNADGTVDIDSVIACIKDSEQVVTKIAKAVQLLATQEFGNVKEALKLIGEAIQQLPDAITDCHNSEEELQNLAKLLTNLLEQLRHPLRLAFTIGKNLILNGVEIFQEINIAVADWNNENYEDFGYQVGKILIQLLSQMTNIDAVIYDKPVVLIVFDGVLDGIVDASGIRAKDFDNCVSGSATVVIDFEEAVRLLEKPNAENVIEALQLFAEGLDALPDAIRSCQAASKEAIDLAKKIVSLIQSLRSPQSFAFHIGKDLIVNGKDIYREINTARVDWKNGQWEDFGFQLGKAMFQIFVGLENMAMIE